MEHFPAWSLGWSDSPTDAPRDWAPAWTPSDVQLVWKEYAHLPDYNFGDNFLQYRWMEDKFWHYHTQLAVPNTTGMAPILRFESIDYRYTVTVAGQTVADGEGMFTPLCVDLSLWAGTTVPVEVLLHPVPKIPGVPEGRDEAAQSCKPPVSYGWDWHPRLVPSGLSGEVTLCELPVSRIEGADFLYTLSEDLTSLHFTAQLRLISPPAGAQVRVTLTDEQGQAAASAAAPAREDSCLSLYLEHPHLWWSRGQGPQSLYTCAFELLDTDGSLLHRVERRVGFRRVRLKMNADDWSHEGFPATQAKYPATIELNGRRIFCKGSNFVPAEIFYSRMTADVYRRVLTLVKDCNMNFLRVWGGGLVNREPFFEFCDEHGIMVWQEFPLACNAYPDDPHYLHVLNRESVSIIKRVKSHPCHILWCGGNELFNDWSGMTNQSLPLRLLDKNCLEHDPWTPFIMTSPLYGMGHGCYLNITTNGCDAVTDFVERERTAYTEFGAPAPAPLDYIARYVTPEALRDVRPGTVWEDHHAFNAWNDVDTWLRPREIEAFYGPQSSFESLIQCGLELQGESYVGMFEEARRKWPHTSMAANWCFNEPWPCFANNSLVLYPDLPRPAFSRVRTALRDRMISVRSHKLRYRPGETTVFELFALNDLPTPMPAGTVRLTLCLNGTQTLLGVFSYAEVPACSNLRFGEVRFTFSEDVPAFSTARLIATADDPTFSSEYLLYLVSGE